EERSGTSALPVSDAAQDDGSQFTGQEYRSGDANQIGRPGQRSRGLPGLGRRWARGAGHVGAALQKFSEFSRGNAAGILTVGSEEDMLEMRPQDPKDAGHVFVIAGGKNEKPPRR